MHPSSPYIAVSPLESLTIDPEAYGIRRVSMEAIKGGDAKENAKITTAILMVKREDQNGILC